MSALTRHELAVLKLIRSIGCKTPGCRCKTWARDVADQIRLACPTVDDATLAHIVMQVIAQAGRYVITCDLTATAANDLLARAAVELAAAELDAPPLADEPGDGKT